MSLSALKEAIVCEAAAQAEAIAKQAASAVQQEQQRTTKEGGPKVLAPVLSARSA